MNTAVSIGTNRTYPNTTNLIHESTVANTCNTAIAALAGSMLVVVGGRLKQAAIYTMRPDHLLEKWEDHITSKTMPSRLARSLAISCVYFFASCAAWAKPGCLLVSPSNPVIADYIRPQLNQSQASRKYAGLPRVNLQASTFPDIVEHEVTFRLSAAAVVRTDPAQFTQSLPVPAVGETTVATLVGDVQLF